MQSLTGKLLASACLLCLLTHSATATERVSQDLLALYDFSETEGSIVADTSGIQPPLDLEISQPAAVAWTNGALTVHRSTTIRTPGPATRLIEAVQSSGELTIEAWVSPAATRQAGPARIVSLSANPSERNVTLGQDNAAYDVRLRTTTTSTNGTPSVPSPDAAVSLRPTHVVFSRSVNGEATLWINGEPATTTTVAGDFSGWNVGYPLVLANEASGDRPWLGSLHLVALYSRALSADEITTNFAAGAPPVIDYAAVLPPPLSRPVDFVTEVQPLLRDTCFDCHSSGNEEGSLNLGIRQRTLEGGEHGAVLVPGNSADSRLVHLIAGLEPERMMPPEGERLTNEQIGMIRAWIDQGAAWPADADMLDPRTERAREHWAFQPLGKPPVPAPAPPDPMANWPITPIDAFVLAKLDEAGLQPSPPASARQLMRRLHYGLTGLPPTPDEVTEFTTAWQQDRVAAWTAVVDQLLASPRYGERWARHWLDVARYADSDGQESDRDRPTAYHYRDFVIRAFNGDMPFDQFVRWQLAGDEYEPENLEAAAATGFLSAGPFAALPDRLMEDERLRNRYNELDDAISTIGQGFLGLTLGCARCHDHKYDAIPSRDYYRLLSALHSGERAEIPLGNTPATVLGWRDISATPQPSWLFRRGDYYDRNIPVQLGFIGVLTQGPAADDYWQQAREAGNRTDTTYQRRAIAEWITDVEHGGGGLLARVIVNRLWQHHFGQGIVRTVGDFGVRSEPPTHPELLEWLAADLVEHGWQLKRLQRRIVTSGIYLQDSHGGDATTSVDPENRLLSRMPLQRLEAEALRDTLLAVSGTLNETMYGPAVRPPIPAEAIVARNLKDGYPGDLSDSPEVRRRSVYLFHKRVVPYPLLQAFDKPDAQQTCSRRDTTTVAPQALALLNDPCVRRVAHDFAERLLRETNSDLDAAITSSFLFCLARTPTTHERDTARAFLAAQQEARAARQPERPAEEIQAQSLADYCQALFGLNELLYID
jgi:hypothetical protein